MPYKTAEALKEFVFVGAAWKVSEGTGEYVGFFGKLFGTRQCMCRPLIGQCWCLCWMFVGGDVYLGLFR